MTTLVLTGAAALAAACLATACLTAGQPGDGAPTAEGAILRLHRTPTHGLDAKPAARPATRRARTAKPKAAKSPAKAVSTRAAVAAQAARPAAAGVRIAVVDTGVTPVGTLGPRMLAGADFVDSDGTTADHNGHGTAMATIAGGVCASCQIVPVRVLGDSGMGTTTLAAQGVRWAAANGARVINLSLTSRGADDDLTSAIEDAVANGVVVVVAAGNSGSGDPAAEGYPGAAAADALTVASVDGTTGQFYPWSNRGSWVHLAGPGVLQALSTTGQPVSAVGTSGSAAYVSGAVGLLLSCNPSLDPAQVQSILASTAQAAAPAGVGVVDPRAALGAATPAAGCAA